MAEDERTTLDAARRYPRLQAFDHPRGNKTFVGEDDIRNTRRVRELAEIIAALR